jgi:hypothetical protein
VKRRPGMFYGWWFDPATGRRLQRATRAELAAAYKTWARHADVRLRRVRPS